MPIFKNNFFFHFSEYTPETYTSLKENRCEDVSVASDKLVTVVDFPGCEKLRKQLFENYLQKVCIEWSRIFIIILDCATSRINFGNGNLLL